MLLSCTMNLNDLDLNLLCAFDALMAEQNVTRAARRMGLGQPAMSDALRRLRLLFGDQLFVRAAGGMQPTPRARAIAKDIGPLLVRLRAVMGEQVSFVPQSAEKTFTIASTDFTTLVLLPSLVAAVRSQAPGAALRITGYEKDAVGGMLDRGEIDLAIGVFPDPSQNNVRSQLFEDRFVGMARADHPALRGGGMDIDTFASLPHALVSVRRDDRGAVDRALETLGLRRRITLVVPYMLMLPRVLATSDLIATLPERAAHHLAHPALVTFVLPVPLPAWSVDMLWNPSARTDQASAWLRNLIATTAKTLKVSPRGFIDTGEVASI